MSAVRGDRGPAPVAERTFNLPPLKQLVHFEAAARHLSFKNAAVEQNVTAAAVSHQVRSLESELGLSLFERTGRGVTLSPEGRLLFEALNGSLHQVSRAIAEVRQAVGDPASEVSISLSSTVSVHWLTPRLGAYYADGTGVRIDQHICDDQSGEAFETDLQIRFGPFESENLRKTKLFHDVLRPVAAPGSDGIHDLAALAGANLIHIVDDASNVTDWYEWFSALDHGGPVSVGHCVNDYLIGIELAQQGLGIALGWTRLLNSALETGALATLGEMTLETRSAFYVVENPGRPSSDSVRSVRDWLVDAS